MKKFLKPSALATVLFLMLQGLGTEKSSAVEPTRFDFNGNLTNTSGQFNGVSDSKISYVNPLQIGGTAYYPLRDNSDAEADTGAKQLVDDFTVEPTVVPGDSQLVKQTLNNLTEYLNGLNEK